MKLENATLIDFGDIELLANKEKLYMGYNNEAKFKINWCRLKEKPDELILLNEEHDKLSQEIKDKKIPIVDIGKIIELQLEKILEKELNSFIGKNINNISYFFEKEEQTDVDGNKYYRNTDFLDISDIGIDYLMEKENISHKARVYTSALYYDQIHNSILKYRSSHYASESESIEVDMREKKILTEPGHIMNQIYSEVSLCKILAYKQYELGITPPFYNEIAKINKFLKDKKTVTVILDDDREIKTKADIEDIIEFYNGVFNLKEKLFDIELFDDNLNKRNIKKIKGLRNGKTEISINTENLKPLELQLDEIIKNENVGIICNVSKNCENEERGDTNEI